MTKTARWALPLLEAGQAQKEMGHNEALAAIDLLMTTAVLAVRIRVRQSAACARCARSAVSTGSGVVVSGAAARGDTVG